MRELLKLGAKHDAKKSGGAMAVHRAASSALSDGPPTDTCSKNAANAVRLLVEASEGGADAGTLGRTVRRAPGFLCARAGRRPPSDASRRRAPTRRRRFETASARRRSRPPRDSPARSAPPSRLARPRRFDPPGGRRRFTSPRRRSSTAGESTALVRALLDAGADADATDGEGLKAVHAAAAVGRIPVVEMLLKVTSPDEGVAASDWTAAERAENHASRSFAPSARRRWNTHRWNTHRRGGERGTVRGQGRDGRERGGDDETRG